MVSGIESIRSAGWLGVDVAFLHTPHHITRNPPFQYYLLPMGMIMLANLLNEEGIESRVFNLGIELQKGTSLEKSISAIDAHIFAIDIHWYVHLYDAVTVASMVKKIHPHAYIVIGGLTASRFAREILETFQFIDAVIKGDAEIPMLQLVTAFMKGKKEGFHDIPNIVYRDGSVRENDLQYVAHRKELSRLPYVKNPLPVNHEDTFLHREMQGESCFPTLWFCCARGCTFNCCWCGGAHMSHEVLTGRHHITVRDPERVADEVITMASRLNTASFSHDLAVLGKKYCTLLFSRIREESLDIGCYWEIFDPSRYSEDFLMQIARSFHPQRSKFAVSLGSALPAIREKSGMASFTNTHFVDLLHSMRDMGFQVEGYFHVLPPETYESMYNTLQFVERIQKELHIPFFYWSPTLDPASPMQLYPETYGIISRLHSFSDYWKACSGAPFTGYDLPHFTEKDMISLSTGQSASLPESVASLYREVTQQRNSIIGISSDESDLSSEILFI